MINYVICQQLVLTLAHFLWQASVIGIIAYGLTRMLKHSPPTHRYAVCCVALFCLPLVATTTFVLLAEPVRTAAYTKVEKTTPQELPAVSITVSSAGTKEAMAPNTVSTGVDKPTAQVANADSAADLSHSLLPLAPWIVGAYFIGVVVCFVRLCIAFRGGSRLQSTSLPVHDPTFIRIVTEQSIRLGMKVRPAIRFCERVVAPTVVGIIKPTVLLPPALMTGLGPEQLSAMISHELAHIRRRDLFVNLIQRLIESILFFHPVVWLLSRQMNREREACCDDLALLAGHDRLSYADSLLKMVELAFGAEAGNGNGNEFSMAVSDGNRSDLEHRIQRLLNPLGGSRIRLTRTGWMGLFASVCILPVLFMVFHWSANASEPDGQNEPIVQVANDETKVNEPNNLKQAEVGLATRIGRATHQRMSAIDRLPRFYWSSNNATLTDFVLENPSEDALENLIRSLDAHGRTAKWYRYHAQFGWDENHFVQATGDGEQVSQFHWGTREMAGERNGRGPSPSHVLQRNASAMWESIYLTYPNYILASRHVFWWGENADHKKILAGTGVPPVISEYEKLDDMKFDGELCQVVRSTARQEMLIISKATGLLRGYVLIDPKRRANESYKSEVVKRITGVKFSTAQEYRDWYQENESKISEQQKWELTAAWSMSSDWSEHTASLLVRFRDYREIAPGIMWPFREDRVQGSMGDGKFECMRSYDDVEEIAVDLDLTERVNSMRPKDGEQVQDQRFQAIVNYKFDKNRTNAELMKMVDTEFTNQMKDRQFVEQLKEPFEKMIGGPAPALPAANWVGGERPSLSKGPYLIHFWATWCGPCKNDLPILKQFADSGATVVGVHPHGTNVDEVREAIKDAKLPYPTYVSTADASDKNATIAGYPAAMFPYCVLVDGKGIVVAHGALGENDFALLAKYRALVDGTSSNPSSAKDKSVTTESTESVESAVPKVDDTSAEMIDVQVHVAFQQAPVAGAKVVPHWISTQFGDTPLHVASSETDESGIARVRLPKFGPEQSPTISAHLGVSHPDFCYATGGKIVDGVVNVSLRKGYRVETDAIDSVTGASIKEGLFATHGSWKHIGNGRLQSSMIDYHSRGSFGGYSCFRLVHVNKEGTIGFSDVVGVYPRRRGLSVAEAATGTFNKRRVPIYQSVALTGRIDERVPRPVKGGRVMIIVQGAEKKPRSGKPLGIVEWVDWTTIETDGTFKFDALPRDEKAELMAVCDGFVSTPELYIESPFGWNLVPVDCRIGNQDTDVTVPMFRTGTAKIRLVDSSQQPIANATVSIRGDHNWQSNYGDPLYHRVRSVEVLKKEKREPDQPISAVTDEDGIVTLENVIPDRYDIMVEHDKHELRPNTKYPFKRFVSARVPTGKTLDITLDLVPRGTTKLKPR